MTRSLQHILKLQDATVASKGPSASEMSQMLRDGRGQGGRGGYGSAKGRGRAGRSGRRTTYDGPRAHKSNIAEIADDTFNTGHSRFVAQFSRSRENVANYIARRIGGKEGHLLALEVKTGQLQTVTLPAALAQNAGADEQAVRAVLLNTAAKNRGKLDGARPSAYSIVYNQFVLAVKDKLKASED